MYSIKKEIKTSDFQSICRTCMHNNDLKPIHDFVVIEILHKIADIDYVQNSGLPHQICEDCIKKIYEIKEFSNKCKEVDFALTQCLIDSKNQQSDISINFEHTPTPALNQNIPFEPILIKEEPTEDTNEQIDESVNNKLTDPPPQEEPEHLDLVTSYKKHFLAMESEESSNDANTRSFMPKAMYRNLFQNSTRNISVLKENAGTSNVAFSENDSTNSSISSISSKEEKSILKQMLKEKSEQKDAKQASELTYECGLCLKQFSHLNQFITHQSEHSDRSLYKCDLCYEEFKDQASVKNHKKVHSDSEKLQCLICFKIFKDSTYLIRHGRVHGNRPYKCDQCDKSYIESGHLVVHKRTHTGEKPFVCEVCSKAFICLSNLVKHRIVHTGQRKIFKCDVCGKEVNDASNLRKHKRVHSGEKPFRCKYCEKAFSGASDLRAHERSHTGERPYACDHCGRKFTRSTYLTKHKKSCVDSIKIE